MFLKQNPKISSSFVRVGKVFAGRRSFYLLIYSTKTASSVKNLIIQSFQSGLFKRLGGRCVVFKVFALLVLFVCHHVIVFVKNLEGRCVYGTVFVCVRVRGRGMVNTDSTDLEIKGETSIVFCLHASEASWKSVEFSEKGPSINRALFSLSCPR